MSAPTPTRRLLLGSLAAMSAPVSAAEGQTVRSDAALIAACAELMAIETESRRLWDRTYELYTSDHPDWRAAEAHARANRERISELEQIVLSTRALTIEGIRAKAAYAATFIHLNLDGTPEEDVRFTHAIFSDLAAWGAPV